MNSEALSNDSAKSSGAARNYVLAHGSWHGGWCWRPVADRLRAAGHRVFTPSYTGMGDRVHLLSSSITIDTFIEDLLQVIRTEELNDVILVGHSFGGVPITGVADRIPESIAHLVYFDAVVLHDGEHSFSSYPKEEADARIESAAKAADGLAVPVPNPLPKVWGIEQGTWEYEWATRRMTPHPLGSYTTPLVLEHPIGNGLPCSYIHCTQPSHPILERSRERVKAQADWSWIDIEAPHEAHITHPELMADTLLQFAEPLKGSVGA